MRYLITLFIAALSFNAFSQGIPQLPYNPDENGDGLIGVPDLQGLLSQYGLEFNSAILSEDGENAVVSLGDMSYPECAASCRNLPGFWSVASLEDLGMVWSTINSNTWLKPEGATPMFLYNFPNPSILTQYYSSAKCYCAAHEMPKVEYFKCTGAGADAHEECVECVQQKLLLGWQLLQPGGSSAVQDLWRWAVE
jgi:hypothetical protein